MLSTTCRMGSVAGMREKHRVRCVAAALWDARGTRLQSLSEVFESGIGQRILEVPAVAKTLGLLGHCESRFGYRSIHSDSSVMVVAHRRPSADFYPSQGRCI